MAVRTISAADTKPDSALKQAIEEINDMAAAINALTAKLDSDAGVTDTDYASSIGTMDTIKLRETGETP